jgi:hypothetical protein
MKKAIEFSIVVSLKSDQTFQSIIPKGQKGNFKTMQDAEKFAEKVRLSNLFNTVDVMEAM